MTPAEIFAQAKSRGVEVGLNPAGDGLRVWSDDDPPDDLVELLRSVKAELVAHLRACQALAATVDAARPPDVSDGAWQTALRGLRAFSPMATATKPCVSAGRATSFTPSRRYGARVDLCGAALLIGDCEVIEVTATKIQIKTASGAMLTFYRDPGSTTPSSTDRGSNRSQATIAAISTSPTCARSSWAVAESSKHPASISNPEPSAAVLAAIKGEAHENCHRRRAH